MRKSALDKFKKRVDDIRDAGTFKEERIITTPQGGVIDTTKADSVVNMCSNNYLGLANDPELIQAAKDTYDTWGYGCASVRFICGTLKLHKDLEAAITRFLGTEDTILYSSCFDANGGLFESLLDEHDAIISDELNHASIIDGVRLCKAMRYRYKNNDMDDLKAKLEEAKAAGAQNILIATDGVFSMDGYIANLKGICDLADQYDALTMVDDSHAVGFMGDKGRGTPEYCGVQDRIDIITGTLGKAMGGASGGSPPFPMGAVPRLRCAPSRCFWRGYWRTISPPTSRSFCVRTECRCFPRRRQLERTPRGSPCMTSRCTARVPTGRVRASILWR